VGGGREGEPPAGFYPWTRGGITDYSLSRPICQAARRTTRSQALYREIKWLDARAVARCVPCDTLIPAPHLPPANSRPRRVKYRGDTAVGSVAYALLAHSSGNYIFFVYRRIPATYVRSNASNKIASSREAAFAERRALAQRAPVNFNAALASIAREETALSLGRYIFGDSGGMIDARERLSFGLHLL